MKLVLFDRPPVSSTYTVISEEPVSEPEDTVTVRLLPLPPKAMLFSE